MGLKTIYEYFKEARFFIVYHFKNLNDENFRFKYTIKTFT